ncbi:hypothetical protein [Halorubrum saccharovorum]|uniref:hypothetical protein n=1 Tax=Halorubrum saccharovorum TaxID=2248 RepID=UPI001F2221BE|nr:hypothetical protein [Halorubrum saccharovorum]
MTTTSPRVTPGRTNELSLQISNNGDMDLGTAQTRDIVTTARNVRVTAEADDNALDVETGTVAIGAVTDSAPGEAPIAVTVPEGVEEGTYELDVELEYSYTRQQSGASPRTESGPSPRRSSSRSPMTPASGSSTRPRTPRSATAERSKPKSRTSARAPRATRSSRWSRRAPASGSARQRPTPRGSVSWTPARRRPSRTT